MSCSRRRAIQLSVGDSGLVAARSCLSTPTVPLSSAHPLSSHSLAHHCPTVPLSSAHTHAACPPAGPDGVVSLQLARMDTEAGFDIINLIDGVGRTRWRDCHTAPPPLSSPASRRGRRRDGGVHARANEAALGWERLCSSAGQERACQQCFNTSTGMSDCASRQGRREHVSSFLTPVPECPLRSEPAVTIAARCRATSPTSHRTLVQRPANPTRVGY